MTDQTPENVAAPQTRPDEVGLQVEIQDTVLCLTLANAATRNALVPPISRAIMAELDAATRQDIGAVLITGAGGHFCSGGDVNGLGAQQALPPVSQFERIGVLNDLIRSLRQCPLPVVAAVEGVAAGAGFSLMLACDLTVAAQDARFTMAYIRLGLTPDGGGSHHLARALPAPRAFAALALGESLGAQELQAAGLVHALTPPGGARDAALTLARQLAGLPRRALADIKQLVHSAALHDMDAQLERERTAFVRNLHTPASRQAVQAFLNRRKTPKA